MARGRKPIVVNREELQMAIRALESMNTFTNRSQLWDAVEKSQWALGQPKPLSGQMAMLKAKEFNLEIKTPIGKRGREKGCGPIPGGGRRKRRFNEESIVALKNGIPAEERVKREKTINKAATGSLKAAVKLKCLDCTNWTPGEIATCQIQECSLWNYRPYKRSSVVKELL